MTTYIIHTAYKVLYVYDIYYIYMLIFLVERWLNICFADFIGEYDDQGLNLGAFPKQVSDATIFSVILL
jgi:hypothetical protein